MNRTLRPPAALALVAMLAVISEGCSNASPPRRVRRQDSRRSRHGQRAGALGLAVPPPTRGGVRLIAVQLVRARGAHVIATASTDNEIKFVREHGADESSTTAATSPLP